MAPDVEHNISLSQYTKAYPDARVIGPLPLVKKRPDIKVSVAFMCRPSSLIDVCAATRALSQFDGVFGRDSTPLGELLTKTGEIQAEYFDVSLQFDRFHVK